jgi:hypothetical protein
MSYVLTARWPAGELALVVEDEPSEEELARLERLCRVVPAGAVWQARPGELRG